MIAAIIPAAGRSGRMGAPKALLSYRGTTFLGSILEATRALGLRPRIVAVAADHDNILSQHDLSDVSVVTNAAPQSGPIGSVRAGLEIVVNHPVDGVLVWHVDQPRVSVETVRELMDRFRVSDLPIVVPVYGGRRGHPVIFGRAVFAELERASDGEGARAVVRAEPSRVAEVLVQDPAVLESIDTPEAYAALLRELDHRR